MALALASSRWNRYKANFVTLSAVLKMSDVESFLDRRTTVRGSLPLIIPRVLITGACHGIGRACAETLAAHGAGLILCDRNRAGLNKLAEAFGATTYHCNVSSETSVAKLAARVFDQHHSLAMVINAAGGGYERTLGMYRVSRALLPALRRGAHKFLVNIPPSVYQADKPIFPYVSSRLAYCRLSAALACETREMPITVIIGCPATGRLCWVLPDPNAGSWADECTLSRPSDEGMVALAEQIASLLNQDAASGRRAS